MKYPGMASSLAAARHWHDAYRPKQLCRNSGRCRIGGKAAVPAYMRDTQARIIS